MSLAILFHFLCTQHVSDINISIIRSLRLCCCITTSVVLFSKDGGQSTSQQTHIIKHHKFTLTLNPPSLQNKTTDVVIHQHSRKLLMMDILISETCWVHKKWNKLASDIKLVFYSSIVFMYSKAQYEFWATAPGRIHWVLNTRLGVKHPATSPRSRSSGPSSPLTKENCLTLKGTEHANDVGDSDSVFSDRWKI